MKNTHIGPSIKERLRPVNEPLGIAGARGLEFFDRSVAAGAPSVRINKWLDTDLADQMRDARTGCRSLALA